MNELKYSSGCFDLFESKICVVLHRFGLAYFHSNAVPLGSTTCPTFFSIAYGGTVNNSSTTPARVNNSVSTEQAVNNNNNNRSYDGSAENNGKKIVLLPTISALSQWNKSALVQLNDKIIINNNNNDNDKVGSMSSFLN